MLHKIHVGKSLLVLSGITLLSGSLLLPFGLAWLWVGAKFIYLAGLIFILLEG